MKSEPQYSYKLSYNKKKCVLLTVAILIIENDIFLWGNFCFSTPIRGFTIINFIRITNLKFGLELNKVQEIYKKKQKPTRYFSEKNTFSLYNVGCLKNGTVQGVE